MTYGPFLNEAADSTAGPLPSGPGRSLSGSLPKTVTFPTLAELQAVVKQLQPEMKRRGHQLLEILYDPKLQIAGFVSIHSTERGPALGGLRNFNYRSALDAAEDVLNLAEGMSYKALGADLPLGGGKAVLIEPPAVRDEEVYYGRVGELLLEACPKGSYISAEDMGTTVQRLGYVSKTYPYTVGLDGGSGDPSPATALGVFLSIEAINRELLGNLSLEGKTVAIQGVGNVGMHLAERLHGAGAKLIVADINPELVKKAVERFGAEECTPEDILYAECDILAPCARGGVLTPDNVGRIRAKEAVIGSANNVIRNEDEAVHRALHKMGIVYAPDFIVSAGGLCQVALDIKGDLLENLVKNGWSQVKNINDTGVVERIHSIPERLIKGLKEVDGNTPPSLLILERAKQALRNTGYE